MNRINSSCYVCYTITKQKQKQKEGAIMKMKKRFLIMTLAVSMLSTTLAFASQSKNSSSVDIQVTDMTDEEFAETEREGLAKYDQTFLAKQEVAASNYEKMQQSFQTTKSANAYPDYYGGAYIDDSGDLVVYVYSDADSKSTARQDLSQVMGTASLTVKEAQFSYNELTSVMDKLNRYVKANNDSDSNGFSLFYLSDKDNRIIVELTDLNEENIKRFKENVMDSPIIEFNQSKGEMKPEINMNPGQSITTVGSGSMGYRARRNGRNGFVSAGHMGSLNDTVSVNGVNIGTITARQASGSVEATFIEVTNSNYTPTNTINGTSNTLSTTTSRPGVGTVINKCGASTGSTSGKILSTNATITVNGVTYTDITTADYSSAGGDSGGIVYSYVSSTNTRYTLGTHSFSDGSTRSFIKADNTNTALSLTRY